MQTREHVLDTLNHDGAKVFAKGMIRRESLCQGDDKAGMECSR